MGRSVGCLLEMREAGPGQEDVFGRRRSAVELWANPGEPGEPDKQYRVPQKGYFAYSALEVTVGPR
jgi:hypothetical protein